MSDHKMMYDCFLCSGRFQFCLGRYAGKPINAWDIMVCESCYRANHDGIVPGTYPHLIEHLKSRGMAVAPNAKGWIDWLSSN
jgi:hypothetical protein